MITGAHVLLYANDAGKARTFFRDMLGFGHVDAGDGWLIFALPPAEIGVHPAAPDDPDAENGVVEHYLMCDDVEATVADLRAKGVEVLRPVADRGWGLVTAIDVPGFGAMGLYQPRHPTAHRARPARAAGARSAKPRGKAASARKGAKAAKRAKDARPAARRSAARKTKRARR